MGDKIKIESCTFGGYNNMKQISKNQIEFDVIVKTVTPVLTCEDDVDKIEVYINYFDIESELNLVIKGKYDSEFIKYLTDASMKMKCLRLVVTVKEGEKFEVIK